MRHASRTRLSQVQRRAPPGRLASATPAAPQSMPRAPPQQRPATPAQPKPAAVALPAAFADGRYNVRRFLGEGAKKRVYLAARHQARPRRRLRADQDRRPRRRRPRPRAPRGAGDGPPRRPRPHRHHLRHRRRGRRAVHRLAVHGRRLRRGPAREGRAATASRPSARCASPSRSASRSQHAHGRGIIHRDLKPGNVWLDADGNAALGDFGLAVAIDRSRMTMQGMMVGTVAYMPPEQALGRTPDARSDLYALGAMLYEMVDRPPAVPRRRCRRRHQPAHQHAARRAVLAQPRVPEAARSADPAPAREVARRAPGLRPGRRAGAAPHPRALDRRRIHPRRRSPTARRPARAQLGLRSSAAARRWTSSRRRSKARSPARARSRCSSASPASARRASRRSSASTRACAARRCSPATATRASRRCRTAPSSRRSASTRARAPTRSCARSSAPARPRSRRSSPRSASASRTSRRRRSSTPRPSACGCSRASRSSCTTPRTAQPLVLHLDDLHWADKPSLLLLQHLAQRTARDRLLILGAYRDVELDRTHPLVGSARRAAPAAELPPRAAARPAAGVRRRPARRSSTRARRAQPARQALAAALYQETEGNPFFIREVLAHLIESGKIVHEDGRWVGRVTSIAELGIPEGVREVIGRRLSRLSRRLQPHAHARLAP